MNREKIIDKVGIDAYKSDLFDNSLDNVNECLKATIWARIALRPLFHLRGHLISNMFDPEKKLKNKWYIKLKRKIWGIYGKINKT